MLVIVVPWTNDYHSKGICYVRIPLFKIVTHYHIPHPWRRKMMENHIIREKYFRIVNEGDRILGGLASTPFDDTGHKAIL
jgi:hypothetical protein